VVSGQQPPGQLPPRQLPPRIMCFTHHIRAIKSSSHYRVAAPRGVLTARRLGTALLRYYCFDTVLPRWVTACNIAVVAM